jgi:hypothetical protein
MQESLKNMSYMFSFSVVLFWSPKMMFMIDNSVVKSSIYKESFSNPNGVHWDVKARRYRIVGDNLIQCSQGIILTLGIVAFVANVVPKTFIVK